MSNENNVNTMSDNWSVQCSDEELETEGEWYPSPAELESLYEEIEKNGILELEWKCLGRRPPSPPINEDCSNHSNAESNDEEKINDFEFMDELSSPLMRVRVGVENELKGSAKKKTSSFDGILMNMRRHQQLNQRMEHRTSSNTSTMNTN